MFSKLKKKHKHNLAEPKAEPRDLEIIQKEYNEFCWKAGACQYQVKVLQDELALLNKEIGRLNNEAYRRKELDAAAAPKPTEEVKSEQA